MKEQLEYRAHWQAVDRERGIARDYQLIVTLDLFGWTIVERRWGRIGSRGQQTRDSFPNAALATQFADAVRRRRASAKDRIGVEYRLIG